MVGFVDHDGLEIILVELPKPFLPHQCLHRANYDPIPGAKAALIRFLYRAAQPHSLLHLVRRLGKQLTPVG